MAEVHHKVAKEVRNDEDVLTSSVFGLLDLTRPDLCLLPWLEKAVRQDGQRLRLAGPYESAHLRCWPRYPGLTGKQTEPDVILSFVRRDLSADLVVIEVKYRSGLSGWPVGPDLDPEVCGQLGREWSIAAGLPHGEAPGGPLMLTSRSLIYLTPDSSMPRQAMEASVEEYRAKRNEREGGRMAQGLYWLCWLDLCDVARQALTRSLLEHERRVFRRLLNLLTERRLTSMDRLRPPKLLRVCPWHYGCDYAFKSPCAKVPKYRYPRDQERS